MFITHVYRNIFNVYNFDGTEHIPIVHVPSNVMMETCDLILPLDVTRIIAMFVWFTHRQPSRYL